ncbi:MAG: copper chaperone PCu(A)C [Polaromonas sp.]|nr:copper chaperone PCu(A)C [Polaromonas sp.]
MTFFLALQRTTACAASVCALALLAPGVAAAQGAVQVQGAWVRTAVPGQPGTGAFMTLTARESLRLVRISTPAAAVAEVHQMKMDGNVMTMRPISALDLPAGRTVELKPAGYHLMLTELKQPLPPGSSVQLTLHFKNAQGVESQQLLTLPVAATAPRAADTPAAGKAPAMPVPHGPHSGDHKH